MADQLPERVQHLEGLSAPPEDWSPIEQAIRPDRRGFYIEKARRAAAAGLWDSAMLYFWNEAMNDLRRKVVSYGIEYFPFGQDYNLSDEESLRDHVNDYQLIEGCYQLGIVSKEAWFFLQRSREIRNHYSAAHQSESQVDPIEAVNFIKNCVKYVLTYDPPAPGFSIRDFIQRLRDDDISAMIDEIKTAMSAQASEIREALLNRLFDEYLDVSISPTLRKNTELVAPPIWQSLPNEAHSNLAQRYVRVRVGPSQDSALLAFTFFKLVGGIASIPAAYRRPIFEGDANELIRVHFEPNNFYKEGPAAKQLLQLGPEVPSEAVVPYAKAVLLSFIGNRFGYCWDADEPNRQMLSRFNIDTVKAVISLLDSDKDVQLALTDEEPAARLQELIMILLDRPILPAHKKRLDRYLRMSTGEVTAHFMEMTIPF